LKGFRRFRRPCNCSSNAEGVQMDFLLDLQSGNL
jgi:hypothetical protein